VTIHPTDLNHPDPASWLATQGDAAACSICGTGRPDACWVGHGHTVLWTCRNCALSVLPALIADAVGARRDAGRPMAPYAAAVPQIVGRFWQAVACRLASRLRAGRDCGVG
jgi:hypothetical protein